MYYLSTFGRLESLVWITPSGKRFAFPVTQRRGHSAACRESVREQILPVISDPPGQRLNHQATAGMANLFQT